MPLYGPEDGAKTPDAAPPITADGRYIVVRDRLWRATDPGLSAERKAGLVGALMAARRAGRAAVDAAKHDLGERGKPWWDDDAPDLNRQMVAKTPYAAWYAQLVVGGDRPPGQSA